MPIFLRLISSGQTAFTWIDADGSAHALDASAGYAVMLGVRDRWMPQAAWIEDAVPSIPGAVLRDVTIRPLDFLLPLHVSGATSAQLYQRLRDLLYWFDPRRGDGELVVTAPDGTSRGISCRATSLDLVEDARSSGATWQIVAIALHAPDPYWHATSPEEQTFTANLSSPVPFLAPTGFFGLHLYSSAMFAAATVNNPGTVEAWPTWTIVGPGTNPSLRNLTTGDSMVFNHLLGAGDQLVVELARDDVAVSDGLGTPLFSALSNTSTAWPLRPGLNQVQIGMDGASGASRVSLRYVPRFLGP